MHPLLASFSVSLCLLLSLSLVGEYVETQMLCHAQFLPVHCLSVLASIRLYFSPLSLAPLLFLLFTNPAF